MTAESSIAAVSALWTDLVNQVAAWSAALWRLAMGDFAARPAALFTIVAVAIVIVLVLFSGVGRPVYQRGRFLTPNEKSFLGALDAAIGPGYRVFAQVRLAELVAIGPGDSRARRRAFYAVASKSVDFVVCNILTLDPVAAIEVDERTHLRADLTSAMIDSRDFLAAKRRAETEVMLPAGPKIAFSGGDTADHKLIWAKLDQIHAKHPDMVLMHGGSPKGAEKIAARWADTRKVPQVAFEPDWTKHAKAAPFKRNDAMLNVMPIGVIVFPGTGIQDNLADKARKLGIPVYRFGNGGA